jgi:hypothetical protein
MVHATGLLSRLALTTLELSNCTPAALISALDCPCARFGEVVGNHQLAVLNPLRRTVRVRLP